METKRGGICVLVIALILTLLLQRITSPIIAYDIAIKIVSAFFYYSFLVIIVIDGYYAIKYKEAYHRVSVGLHICLLLGIILLFSCVTNWQAINKIAILICFVIVAIFGYIFAKKVADYIPEVE